MDAAQSRPLVNREEAIPVLKTGVDSPVASGTGLTGKLQDRLFSSLFQQFLPADEASGDAGKAEKRSKKGVDRPNFSLPLMSNNFRRFNARIGVVFVFQNRAIGLFSWKHPTQTLSFLAMYTLCCLDPNLLAMLPLVACLFFIMVPAFYSRHPPPPTSKITDAYAGQGPASAPPANIKPAPDMSKDFFRNMRDLQNCMEDFSIVHDQLVNLIAPVTNFSDERLSSTVFNGAFLTTCILFIASNLLPWKLTFLILGWILIGSAHPKVMSLLQSIDKRSIREAISRAQDQFHEWMMADVVLDEAPEMREVEVFELQRHISGIEWEMWVYSTSPYDPQSPIRVSGDRPRGTRFFEDVQPPKGWEWSDKKWSLDLLSREWVEERMITAVEVEMEGERWVYDIGLNDSPEGDAAKGSTKPKVSLPKKVWEEGSGLDPKGDWRRRRWVRLVKRRTLREFKESKG